MNNIPDGYQKPEDDAAGLRVDVGFKDGRVILEFSKPTMHMSLLPQHARSFAIALLQNSEMALAEQAKNLTLPPTRLK